MDQTHVMNLMFALDLSNAPILAQGNYITAPVDAQIGEGDLTVCNDQMCVVDATTVLTDGRVALNGVQIVGRLNNQLYKSDMIKVEDLISYTGLAYAAAAEQVTYIGYTGAASSIRVINDNVYKMKINFTQIGRTGQGRQEHIDVMYHSADAATAAEVAIGLMTNLNGSLKAQPESTIVARLHNSTALVAGDRFTSTVTYVQGSKYLTFSANFLTVTGVDVLAVGDFIRIGNAADSGTGAVALGSTVYRVEELVSATVVRIDRPFTGTSGTNDGSTDTSLIIAADANASDFGIRLTGVAPAYVLGKRPWGKIVFTVGLEDFGATEVAYNTVASLGRGTENQLRDLEYFCKGNKGNTYRADARSYTPYTSAVSAGDTFAQLNITWASKSNSEGINGPGHNPKQLILALETAYDNTDATDILIETLDAYFTVASGLAK